MPPSSTDVEHPQLATKVLHLLHALAATKGGGGSIGRKTTIAPAEGALESCVTTRTVSSIGRRAAVLPPERDDHDTRRAPSTSASAVRVRFRSLAVATVIQDLPPSRRARTCGSFLRRCAVARGETVTEANDRAAPRSVAIDQVAGLAARERKRCDRGEPEEERPRFHGFGSTRSRPDFEVDNRPAESIEVWSRRKEPTCRNSTWW